MFIRANGNGGQAAMVNAPNPLRRRLWCWWRVIFLDLLKLESIGHLFCSLRVNVWF